MKRSFDIMAIAYVVSFHALTSIIAAPLSGDQLYLLMQSSRNRYQSMETVLDNRGYQFASDQWDDPQLQYSVQILYRCSDGRYFGQIQRISYDNGKITDEFRESILIGRDDVRSWIEHPVGAVHRAVVQPGSFKQEFRKSGKLVDILDHMWDSGRIEWNTARSRFSGAMIRHEEESGYYVVEFPLQDSPNTCFLRLFVDPSKDYIPVKSELLFPDRSLFVRTECKEWQTNDNVWVPWLISWRDPTAKFGGDFRIQSVAVNIPIAEDKYLCEFPTGTEVDDQIRGVRYVVPKKGDTNAVVRPVNTVDRNVNMLLPSPASDQQLAQAATKGNDRLFKQKSDDTQTPAAVELSPPYVWVLPGKSQYTLKLDPGIKSKPILTSRSFQADNLTLHGVEDRLAETGTILVTLERPDGHKAFADAVLTLDFAGTKVPIHFVAAPLPE